MNNKKIIRNNNKPFDLKRWLRKTLIRVIICFIVFIFLIGFKNINTDTTQNIVGQIRFRMNEEFDFMEGYQTAKKWVIELSERSEEVISVFYFGDNETTEFILPVEGEIIAFFDEKIEGQQNTSKGLIFEIDTEQNIYAAYDGVVMESGKNDAVKNYVIIKHKGEFLTVYKFLEKSSVKPNQRINKGEIIGVGSNKLKFEMWQRNKPVDPLRYIDSDIVNMQKIGV